MDAFDLYVKWNRVIREKADNKDTGIRLFFVSCQLNTLFEGQQLWKKKIYDPENR
jgi:hypothetical protein